MTKSDFDINSLTIFEQEALLTFLKDYVNRDNLFIYEGLTAHIPRHLFLAFVKLQLNIDKFNKAMAYTD